ncbi:MAG: hypothetical protein R2715_00410 [Ilumatobacteraceae bacterium]
MPRRAGTVAPRFVDPATSLPNRIALMSRMNYGLMNFPFWLAMVVVEIHPPHFLDDGIDGDSRAVAARRDACEKRCDRPTRSDGSTISDRGRRAVGLGGKGDPAHSRGSDPSIVRPTDEAARRSANDPISFQIGLGLARPTQTPTVALTTAWTAMRAAPVTIPGRSADG